MTSHQRHVGLLNRAISEHLPKQRGGFRRLRKQQDSGSGTVQTMHWIDKVPELISHVLQYELRGRTIRVTAMHKHAGRFCNRDQLVIFKQNGNQRSLFYRLNIIHQNRLKPNSRTAGSHRKRGIVTRILEA